MQAINIFLLKCLPKYESYDKIDKYNSEVGSMLNSIALNFGTLLGEIAYEVRTNVKLAFGILMVIASIAIIVVIMMQKGTNDDVGVISGSSDTYYGKNKERGKESLLKKITLGLFVFIMVCAIICFAVGIA